MNQIMLIFVYKTQQFFLVPSLLLLSQIITSNSEVLKVCKHNPLHTSFNSYALFPSWYNYANLSLLILRSLYKDNKIIMSDLILNSATPDLKDSETHCLALENLLTHNEFYQ